MKFSVQKYNSNFIQSQFPDFYEDDGINFVEFLEYYYKWAESQKDVTSGNPNFIAASRNLFDYRDIDNTLEEFLVHFQKKYLYGIPFNVIVNKRFLLKHVLDVYRSKGNIQAYKLLFKLIYNQDIDVYVPRYDILKPSDGTWQQPLYLEVSDNGNLSSFIGKTIVGLSTNVSAVVENYSKEKVNGGIVSSLYLSNVYPPSLSFRQGETITIANTTDPTVIANSPVVLGSLYDLQIDSSSVNFAVGDILGISSGAHGVNGFLKVTSLTSTQGVINFDIQNNGFGYLANSNVFLYNSTNNVVKPASFSIGSIGYQKQLDYNTDLLCDYLNLPLNSVTYGIPNHATANLSSPIVPSLNVSNNFFGSIVSLSNVSVGNNYLSSPYIFVSSTMQSKNLPGNVSYGNGNIVIGTNTSFSTYFTSNSIITLFANSTVSEKQVIKTVSNNTQLILYGNTINSSTNGIYQVSPSIISSNYTNNDNISNSPNPGNNVLITGTASFGNNNISTVTVYNSGKGYVDNEYIQAYLYNTLNPIVIVNGGRGYSNGESLNFIGGSSTAYVKGNISTDSNGTIISVTNQQGSNFDTVPHITINTSNGNGAILSCSLSTYNTSYSLAGRIIKSGMGKGIGNWTTTRGFLDSDKYIQDSYFYQDFSYQIKAASNLKDYKSILYDTFHPSGSEMFGEYYLSESIKTSFGILEEISYLPLAVSNTNMQLILSTQA